MALAKLVGFVVLHIFLIEPAGWPVAAAVLFSGVGLVARGQAALEGASSSRGPGPRAAVRLRRPARRLPARRARCLRGCRSSMDSFMLLLEGFSTALQPVYLLYALGGVFVGTAVGVLPGIGPAMTVALLMPITYALDPTAALIVFAGIYYGGMYGGSTTSILLNTPGESVLDRHRARGQQDGEGRPGRGGAGDGGDRLVRRRHHRDACCCPSSPRCVAELAVGLGPVDYVALMVVAFLTVGALLGASVLRGLASLAPGAVHRADRHRRQHRRSSASPSTTPPWWTASTWCWWRWGSSPSVRRCTWPRSCGTARSRSSRSARARTPGCPRRTGSGPGSRGCAARSSGSRSAPCRPAARTSPRSCPTPPSGSWPRARTRHSSARAPSRASPVRKRPTTPPPPVSWCRC